MVDAAASDSLAPALTTMLTTTGPDRTRSQVTALKGPREEGWQHKAAAFAGQSML